MPNILRGKLYLGLLILICISTSISELQAQVCPGFPPILALGSNKNPNGLCSPVTATLNYNVTFAAPTPAGTLQIRYVWDDGTTENFNLATGQTVYNHSRNHSFPSISDCEFNVVITLIYNGTACASTRQVQKVASWRTDQFNGGNVQLTAPIADATPRIHEVCVGVPVEVIFRDNTTFNCNQNYIHAPGPLPVETPNTENRWQQIIYNTNRAPGVVSKIPNIAVNGVPVTNGAKGNIIANYQDPRGVFYMASPVLVSTARRPTLQITAPGGFGPAFPAAGDEFQITLRYWNYCNPYDDPNIPGPPSNVNDGDHPPVEQTALIRIVNSPGAPTPTTHTVCYSENPDHFTVRDVPAGYRVNWYENDPGNIPGDQIMASSTSTLNRTATGTGYTNNTTPGVFRVWASVQPNVAGGMNCESPKVMVTRTVRSQLTLPNATVAPPTEICNGGSFTVTMPAPTSLPFGGNTEYTWSGSTGLNISGTPTATSATFNASFTFGTGQSYVDRTVTVRRRFTTVPNLPPNCEVSRNYTIRIYRPSVGGTLNSTPDVCETSPVGTIALSGHIGQIIRWEVKKDAAPFVTYTGLAPGNSIEPGVLPSGVYRFRAVVQNGPCASTNSSEEEVIVSANPGLAANAGDDQFLCGPLTSDPIGASIPTPGVGTWTYISSLSTPTSLPAPTISNVNDRNATITISAVNAGTYVMRWTVANGTCTSFDDVVIDFGANPTDPIAGLDQSICGTTTSLDGNALTIGLGQWIIVNGPGSCTSGAGNCPQLTILNPTSPTSDIELAGTPTYGTYALRWTATSGGASCFYEEDEVLITFDEPALISSAPDVDGGCIDPNNLTPIALSGTMSGGAVSGHWEVVSGDGIVTGTADISNPITDTYTPTINDYNAGIPILVKFVATPAGTSSCLAVEEQVEITIDRKPVADAGSNIGNICNDQVQLSAEMPTPFGATGAWSSTDPGLVFYSSLDGTTIDNTDPNAIVKGLEMGANTVTWTLTSASGLCVSDPSSITLTRVVLPGSIDFDVYECEVAPAGGGVTTITLTNYENDVTALAAADRQITWYRNGPPPSGTLINTPSDMEFGVVNNQLYVARIRDLLTNCTSDANVTIHVRSLPTAINGSAALCEDTPGSGTVSGIDLTDNFYIDKVTGGAVNVDVEWYNTLLDAQTSSFPITAPFDMAGDIKVYARITYSTPTATAPACPTFAELDLLMNTIPTSTGIAGDPTVCMGAPLDNIADLPIYTYQITSIPGAKYHWTVPQGAGEFVVFGGGGINDFFVILKFPYAVAPAVLNISVSIELNTCSSSTINFPITRTEVPTSPIVNGDLVVCENTEAVQYSVTSPKPGSDYIWNIRRQSDNSNGGAFILTGQGLDVIRVNFVSEDVIISVEEVNGYCIGPETDVPVTINLLPRMLDNDVSICSDSPTEIVFQPEAFSPPIDNFDIKGISTTAGINFVVPGGGPTAGVVAANGIEGHIFENLTAVPLTVNYTVEPVNISGGLTCAGPSQLITVTVKPEPQLSPGLNRNICSDDITGITLLSAANTFPADKFLIMNPIVVPAGVVPVDPNQLNVADGTTFYNDDVIRNHRFINTSGSNQVVSYSIIPYSTLLGCSGNPPTTVDIVVHPQTNVDVSPFPITVCNGSPINIAFSSPDNPDADFQWIVKSYSPDVQLGSPAAGQGNNVAMIATNSSLVADGTIEFEVKGKNIATEETSAGCANPIFPFTVTIIKSPRAENLLGLEACSDAPGGNTYTADLVTLENSVTPDLADPDTEVRWFTDVPGSASAVEIIAPGLNAYLMQSGVPVHVQVQNTMTTCTKNVQVAYTVNPNVSLDDLIKNDIQCFGFNNGQIRVDVLTGTPGGYSYQIKRDTDPTFGPSINTSAATYTFTPLSGGDYTVRATDAKTCFAEKSIQLIEPSALSAVLSEVNAVTCFLGTDGSIETTVTGGTTPYTTYTLTQTGANNATGIFSNLGMGSYLVQVTDANGCTANTNMLPLTQPTQVMLSNVVEQINAFGYNLSCRDAEDGRIDFQVSGGTSGDYTYELHRVQDASMLTQTTSNTVAFFDALKYGNYRLVALDVNGCPSPPVFPSINNPEIFNPGMIGSNMAACSDETPDQIVELAPAFGGLGNYQYRWEQSINQVNWFPIGGETQNEFNPPAITYDPSTPQRFYRRLVTTGLCPEAGGDKVVTLTINPTPVVSVSAPSNVCQGNPGQVILTLTQGTAPITFNYSDGSTTFIGEVGGQTTVFPFNNLQENRDYTFFDIKDGNGCSAIDPPTETVTVLKVNADFAVTSPAAQCPGEPFTFALTVEQGISYQWEFSDGSTEPAIPADMHAPGTLVTASHTFPNGSTALSTVYPVRLKASGVLSGCDVFSMKNVTVYPSINLNMIEGDLTLCSGETFTITDQSAGVSTGLWSYHEVSNPSLVIDSKSGPISPVQFVMLNPTTDDPITYKIKYDAENAFGCTAYYENFVTVYRSVVADFTATVPPFIGGITEVTFTNTSMPVDGNDFDYHWEYDYDDNNDGLPVFEDDNTRRVEYYRPNDRNVRLTVINKSFSRCRSSITKLVEIPLPNLGAAFLATPIAACLPTQITVNNQSPGADIFKWQLFRNGTPIGESTVRDPVWSISAPGSYSVLLEARYSGNTIGAPQIAQQSDIQVFDNPKAIFDVQQRKVYIPGTEIRTINLSVNANEFDWDFDDGPLIENQIAPTHTYTEEGKYTIILWAKQNHGIFDINLDGNEVPVVCYDSASLDVTALLGGTLKVANAFTPNPGGSNGGVPDLNTVNDVFLPIMDGVEEFTMQIFDRWGTLVFESREKNVGWDGYDRNGRLMPAGVYVYKLTLRLGDDSRTTKVGDVTLIR